jgi:hypothetical protein
MAGGEHQGDRTMAYDWALVAMGGDKPPAAWNLYHTEEAAQNDMRRGLREKFAGNRRYATVMPTQDYRRACRDYYLGAASNALKPITAEAWTSALECLPPLHWHRADGVERFCLSEFYTDTLTHQYARLGELYCVRLVDATDRSTWITGDEIRARFAQLREEAQANA